MPISSRTSRRSDGGGGGGGSPGAPATLVRALFRRKPIRDELRTHTVFSRCLSTSQLTFYSVSHMAGAGIYVLTARLIRDQAGPAALFSYALAALSALVTGFCYAEMATLVPRTGSTYTYTYLALGEAPAFLIGWTMLADMLIGIASVAKAFSGALKSLFGLHIWLSGSSPHALLNGSLNMSANLSSSSLSSEQIFEQHPDVLAVATLCLLVLITATGANISLTFNCVIAAAQIACLLTVSIAMLCLTGTASTSAAASFFSNWSPFSQRFLPFGVNGVLQGAGIAVFAYAGFESLANASEETRNPKRSIPLALFLSMCIITALYLMATASLSLFVPRTLIDYSAPFVDAFVHTEGGAQQQQQQEHAALFNAMKWIAGVGTLLATGASKVSSMYVIPRMLYAMANDGLLFRVLGRISRTTKVPLIALLFGGSLSALIACFVRIQILADMTSMGVLISYAIIGLDLLIIRYTFDLRDQIVTHSISSQAKSVKANENEAPKNSNLSKECEEVEETRFHGNGDATGNNTDNKDRNGNDNGNHSDQQENEIKLYARLKLRRICRHGNGQSVRHRLAESLCRPAAFKLVLVAFLLAALFASICLRIFHAPHHRLPVLLASAAVLLPPATLLAMYEPITIPIAFQAPLMPLFPALTILINLVLLLRVAYLTWIRFLVWSACGLLIYFAYGIRNSNLRRLQFAPYKTISKEPANVNSGDNDNEEDKTESSFSDKCRLLK